MSGSAGSTGSILMAKKEIRIKELARELGVTSRHLINRCRAEGIPAQNSITKVSIEHERIIRGWFDTSGTL